MNHNPRIQLDDTMMSAIVKLAEGNPGAIRALFELSKASPTVDPQSAFAELAPIMSLDTHGIYGSDIYVLWNDVCARDSRSVLMLLRAVQLGLLPEQDLTTAAANQCRGNHFPPERMAALDAQVCERLSGFMRQSVAA